MRLRTLPERKRNGGGEGASVGCGGEGSFCRGLCSLPGGDPSPKPVAHVLPVRYPVVATCWNPSPGSGRAVECLRFVGLCCYREGRSWLA